MIWRLALFSAVATLVGVGTHEHLGLGAPWALMLGAAVFSTLLLLSSPRMK